MGLGKNGLILHNERMPILSIGRFTNISPLSYPVKCTVYYEKGRYDMYYDPYMYDGPIYDPWTPVEYDYRYPVGYPGPGSAEAPYPVLAGVLGLVLAGGPCLVLAEALGLVLAGGPCLVSAEALGLVLAEALCPVLEAGRRKVLPRIKSRQNRQSLRACMGQLI